MRAGLEIYLSPERLEEGTPEERACFGLLSMRAGQADLTGGMDCFISSYRAGPLISGYHAAEWFAWNWWRLCHEPRSETPDWWRAHRMTAIGEGYAWPNLTIHSDGVRTTLLAEPSAQPDARPFRYLGAHPCILPTSQFETAVDAFIPRVLGRLREQGVGETDLDRIWRDVLAERADPEQARRRRLEALLGRDPDRVEDRAVEQLVADAAELGEIPAEELAAHHANGGMPPTAQDLWALAERSGFTAHPRDGVRLADAFPLQARDHQAWQLGAAAARALREQLGRLHDPIGDTFLAELAGVSVGVLGRQGTGSYLSFSFDKSDTDGRVVLRSRWETGRRFELARLLADRIVAPIEGRLHVATASYTYRQKMQRSFAAEFLSPFEAVDTMLECDYSDEAQADVAAHFQVSTHTIQTLLMNHGRIEREWQNRDFGTAA